MTSRRSLNNDMETKLELVPGPSPTFVRRVSQRLLRIDVVFASLASLVAACWSLSGAHLGSPAYSDASRHAMNGACLLDLSRFSKLLDPMTFASWYYSRLPAISLPYHPPLFPAIEAIFFSAFGVNLVAARFVVALTVAGSVILAWNLISRSYDSVLAAGVLLTFFSWQISQELATDVMLEFPSLFLVLLALTLLNDFEDYSSRKAMLFGICSIAAVCTKQHTVFLFGVPLAWTVFARHWEKLRIAPVWIPTLMFAIPACICILLASAHGIRIHLVSSWHVWPSFVDNITYYAAIIYSQFGIFLGLLMAAGFVAIWLPRRKEDRLFLVWAVCAIAVLLVLPIHDARYFLYADLPVIVLAYAGLYRIATHVLGDTRYARLAISAIVIGAFVTYARPHRAYLTGPESAADLVMRRGGGRILYCGLRNGAFIFAIRSRNPSLSNIVIRGDKLPPELLSPADLEKFAHRYAVKFIVFEKTSLPFPWDHVAANPSPSMQLITRLPLIAYDDPHPGELLVFRFANPSQHPENELHIKNKILRIEQILRFDNLHC
jgi:Dolichyl-phosphate-mannose-protein mannosyltransferase